MVDTERLVHEIRGLHGRVRVLRQRAVESPSRPQEVLPEVLEELRSSLEELQVAEEELRQQNEELAASREAIERERRRYQELFESAPDGYLVTDADGIIREANRAAARMLNLAADFLTGKPLPNFLPAQMRRAFRVELLRLQRQEAPQGWEVELQPRHRSPFWVSLAVAVVRSPQGQALSLRWLLRDITVRKRTEEQIRALNVSLEQRVRERTAELEAADRAKHELLLREQTARAEAEAAQRRLVFLAGASSLLTASLDCRTNLARLSRLIVPYLADWCAMDLLDEDGQIFRLAATHGHPAREELSRELQGRYPPDWEAPHGVTRVLRTGAPEFFPEVSDSLLAAIAQDPVHHRLLRKLGVGSYLCVPLLGRGRTLGAISLATTDSTRRFTTVDLAVAEDLARRAAAAVENTSLYQEAQAANEAKDQFMALLSHELRAPLTPIAAGAELLRRHADDPERVRQLADVVERNARLQANLVTDLLDLSRIAQGKLSLEPRPVALGKLVNDTLDRLTADVEAAGLTLRWTPPREEVHSEVDPSRFQQILLNLVGNAVKYMPAGGQVVVEVAMVEPAEQSAEAAKQRGYDEAAGSAPRSGPTAPVVSRSRDLPKARLVVADTGSVLTTEAQPLALRMFHQEELEGTVRQGLGLGLALVETLVELHGGRVWAESDGLGKGSRFVVELPAIPAVLATLAATGS